MALESTTAESEVRDLAAQRQADVTRLLGRLGFDLSDWTLLSGDDHPFARALKEFSVRGQDPGAWATNPTCARLAFTAGDLANSWELLSKLHRDEGGLVVKLLRQDDVGGVLGEAFIASQMAKCGLKLDAVPTAAVPTPEFVAQHEAVSAEVEVKVRQYSKHDRDALDFWKSLYDSISPVLSESGWFIQIAGRSASMSLATVGELAAVVKNALETDDAEFTVRMEPNFEIVGRRVLGLRTDPRDLQLHVARLDEFAIFQARARLHPSFSGELDHAIACWRSNRGGHLSALKRAMRRAGQKFSGERHSLVALLLSDNVYGSLAAASRRHPEALFNLANDFAGYLKRTYFPSHPTVSEVRLYMQAMPIVDGIVQRQVTCCGVANLQATMKLPSSFGLRPDPVWSWVNEDMKESEQYA